MTRMTGMILMIIGVLIFVVGLGVFQTSGKKEASIGDKVITPIKEVDDGQSSIIDSSTLLSSEAKGFAFEKFIVQKFDRKYFKLKDWAGDKFVEGIYAESTLKPDLHLSLELKNDTADFYVECKWRGKLINEEWVEYASEKQVERYKSYESKEGIPVFIALGIGGESSAPESTYIIPLRELNSNFIHAHNLEKYMKDISTNFFYDLESNELK